jgi:small-conductance mechanosensitive channel
MALLAVLLHDDPLAANPVTVIQAILRVGWDYAGLCFLGASWFLMMGGMFVVVESITNPLVQPVMLWLFWLILLYSGMVVLRRQGLFCRRHKVVLAWFPDRPMWGR